MAPTGVRHASKIHSSLESSMEEKAKAYPRGYSTEDLENEIDRLGNMSPNNPALGPGYFAKASLGLIELQRRENRIITKLTLGIAALALFVSAYGVWLADKQTDYAEIQSRSERLLQARAIQRAVEYCKQSPESKESGLYNVSNGNHLPCSVVLEQYK